LPAPLLGAIIPGSLSFKAIVAASLAAAQAAYYLTAAEYAIAAAVGAVSLFLFLYVMRKLKTKF